MIDVKRPVETEWKGYFRAPMDEFCELAKKGSVAVFLYSANVLKNGEICHFSNDGKKDRVIKKNGVSVAPVSLFAEFLGAKAEAAGGVLTVSLGKKSITLGANEPYYTEGGTAYVPVEAVAKALDIPYALFHDERLIVFADGELISALKADKMLERAACYAVFGKYSTDSLTHEDFVFAKDKWRKTLVGSPEINDPADPDMKKKLDAISDRCDTLCEKMHKNKDAVILFGDEPPKESCDLRTQYLNIWCLAEAYATYGTRQYKSKELAELIVFAFEWMYENMYGESIIEGRGWRDPHLFNWWEWMTGAIDPMTDALLVTEELFGMETIAKYLRCYDYVSTFHRNLYREDHASTRLKVGTKVALMLEDGERLYYRFLDYDLQFEPLGPQKGKYGDHVCWTHGFPYNMMYGLIYMNRTLFVASNLIGTKMEYTSPDFYDLFLTAKYTYDAAMYRGRGFAVFRGRGFGGEKDSGSNVLNGIIPMLGAFGEEEDTYLKKMIKLGCADPEVREELIARASVRDLALIKEILADESISADNDKEMAYSWFTADRFAQHRNDYAFMLAMPSERHMSYESINSAHKMGWYTGDGALYLYTPKDSKSFEFSAFQSNVNICYRMPGVTADTRERTVWSYRRGWRPSRAYSGSMDFLKKYGVAAFDYEAYHYEGHEADGTTDDGYGGGFTYYENDLVAKKSYFFFDKECVCLGAGINSTMNAPVKTTVEHRRLVPLADSVSVNGEAMANAEFEKTIDAPAFITLSGVASYVFPEKCTVRAARYAYDSSKVESDHYHAASALSKNEFFELGVEHRENPTDASYAYIVLPLTDENSARVYTSKPEIEIISNTAALQAVRKPTLGITAAAFFEPGKLGALEACAPALVMFKEADGCLEISLCDPTQKQKTAQFVINGSFSPLSLDAELQFESAGESCVLRADFENLAGKPLVARLKVN